MNTASEPLPNNRGLQNAALWEAARQHYANGKTARQIAHITGLRPSAITSRAALEQWPHPPPVDWQIVRDAWESGISDRALALQYGFSAATLRKRRERENWSRSSARGIDALRRAVSALEEALDQTDFSDTMATTRLAAALSMAAGRLRVAEKHLLGKKGEGDGAGELSDLHGESEVMREGIAAKLGRLVEQEGGEEEGED